MAYQKGLEIAAVSHLTKINGAQVLQHRFHILHNLIKRVFLLVKRQQEVDSAVFGKTSCVKTTILLAISIALVWSGIIIKEEPNIMTSKRVSG